MHVANPGYLDIMVLAVLLPPAGVFSLILAIDAAAGTDALATISAAAEGGVDTKGAILFALVTLLDCADGELRCIL